MIAPLVPYCLFYSGECVPVLPSNLLRLAVPCAGKPAWIFSGRNSVLQSAESDHGLYG